VCLSDLYSRLTNFCQELSLEMKNNFWLFPRIKCLP
jgi:hypothetical protein